jgi:hypothetical protein
LFSQVHILRTKHDPLWQAIFSRFGLRQPIGVATRFMRSRTQLFTWEIRAGLTAKAGIGMIAGVGARSGAAPMIARELGPDKCGATKTRWP